MVVGRAADSVVVWDGCSDDGVVDVAESRVAGRMVGCDVVVEMVVVAGHCGWPTNPD